MKNYNTLDYCSTCYFCTYADSLMVCINPASERYGSPRNRPSADGQRWIRACKHHIAQTAVSRKYDKFKKLRNKISMQFKKRDNG